MEMLDEANADILVIGHTHKPFHKAVFAERGNNKFYGHIINADSVGKPKHGNNKACYAVLNIDASVQLSDPASIRVNF